MGLIRILPEQVRNQIAAGEVVERPSSIVKELIENSLDAEAKEIEITIAGGGTELICIRDNGCGMSKEDAVMSLKRYATSKITTSADLFALNSFGFRGEALASIASVSKLRLTTREKQHAHAIVLNAHTSEISEVAAPEGTEICIEELFWNVPARRKFLKSATTETAHISKIVESFALAYPHVSFRLNHERRTIIDTAALSGEDALIKRITSLLGREVSAGLVPVHYAGESLQITGFVSHPHIHRRNRRGQRIFVNHRPVQSTLISGALSAAYTSLLPKGRYPDGIVFVQIRPDLVDVNVHPRKTEVKFVPEQEVFLTVRKTLGHALQGSSIAPSAQSSNWMLKSPEQPNTSTMPPAFGRSPTVSKITTFVPPRAFQKSPSFAKPSATNIQAALTFSQNFLASSQHSCEKDHIHDTHTPETKNLNTPNPQELRIIGSVRNSFLLIEEPEHLLIVDQHAAHERVRYEKLMQQLQEKKVLSQKLLVPQVIGLSPSEKNLLEAHQETFTELGFQITEFSAHEISLYAVPAGTEQLDFRTNLKNLLHDLEGFSPAEGKTVSTPAERIATFAACRGAIKFGDALTMPEMEQLIQDLLNCKHPQACAHGRPVWTRISYRQLENECSR